MLGTLDHTICIGSTPTFLYFDLYLYSAYAGHYVYINIFAWCPSSYLPYPLMTFLFPLLSSGIFLWYPSAYLPYPLRSSSYPLGLPLTSHIL